MFGDWLNRIGARGWLTAGSCIAAAPLIAVSLLVPDYKQSFAALLVGFALRWVRGVGGPQACELLCALGCCKLVGKAAPCAATPACTPGS